MVTFNCEVCNATVPKRQTEKHYYRCPNAYYTCIDCSKTFDDGVSYQQHVSCISEDEKYQKALYKSKKGNNNKKKVEEKKVEEKKVEEKKVEKKKTEQKKQEKKIVKKTNHFQDGKSLYDCLKNIKDKGQKKKLLKSITIKESTDENFVCHVK